MSKAKVKVPFSAALRMVGDYAGSRLREQLRSVAFIAVYLVVFQLLVFGSTPEQALRVTAGIGMVIFGLAFFMEGLFLGVMPLGDRVGIRLPARGGLIALIPFGLLLGVGATLAEPAVAALRVMGGEIQAWETPLLFYLLERNPQLLILAIGAGVGLAVAVGLARYYLAFSLKPLLFTIVPVLLLFSFIISRLEKLSPILGLAWDSGAVTTGAVTVPLVLALGIGVSRSLGKKEQTGSGFGIVTLASLFPILGVMVLSTSWAPLMPAPADEEDFFSPENRSEVMILFENEAHLQRYALTHSVSEKAREMVGDEQLESTDSNFMDYRRDFPYTVSQQAGILSVLGEEAIPAARSVLPLTIFLGIVLFLLLRDRPRYLDEVFLGIVFALIGMCLLTAGIRVGLRPLGDESGRRLPQVLEEVEVEKERIIIRDFDPSNLFSAFGPGEEEREFFHYYDGEEVKTLKFRPEWYEAEEQAYVHRVYESPLLHPSLARIGLGLILLFAFGMGFGTTIAEPAVNALGKSVENITVGTVRGDSVVRAISIGVGVGLIVGVLRILFVVPTIWILLPPYIIFLLLIALSDEEFVGIASDSGGVTTGAVTVPLVLAMGVGLGDEIGVKDSFGVLAMASIYPILAVLVFGLFVRKRQRNINRAAEGEENNE